MSLLRLKDQTGPSTANKGWRNFDIEGSAIWIYLGMLTAVRLDTVVCVSIYNEQTLCRALQKHQSQCELFESQSCYHSLALTFIYETPSATLFSSNTCSTRLLPVCHLKTLSPSIIDASSPRHITRITAVAQKSVIFPPSRSLQDGHGHLTIPCAD